MTLTYNTTRIKRLKVKINSLFPFLYLIAIISIGTLTTFSPTLFSGFTFLQTDPGDPRFNNYLMEHSYQWLLSLPQHEHFWNLPIFYPLKNTYAYSDLLLGVAPIYWVYRTLFQPDTSYQLWLISIFILNYLSFFIFLRYLTKLTVFGSSIGSYIFTYSIPRVAQLSHPQLLPGFFIIMSLSGMYGYLLNNTPYKNMYIALFFAGIVLQFYTGYYIAWMWCFSLLLVLLYTFTVSSWRQNLFLRFKHDAKIIFPSAIISFVIPLPLFFHYFQVSKMSKFFPYEDITYLQPRLQSWVYPGTQSLVYSKFSSLPIFYNTPYAYELILFLGFFTTAIMLYRAINDRTKTVTRIMIFTCIALILLTTIYPSNFSLWKYIYNVIPGAKAIRSLGRIILILLIPYSYWVASFINNYLKNRSKILLLIFSSLIIIEQLNTTDAYDKIPIRTSQNLIASAIPHDCVYFFYISNREEPSWKAQIDAMWASIIVKKYTINGYSSWSPLDKWNISENIATDTENLERLISGVNGWIEYYSIPKKDTCIIYGNKVI